MNTTKAAPPMRHLWLDYFLAFSFASFGRIAHDWYFATKEGRKLPKAKLSSAALYSGVTGLAITIFLMWWQPTLQGSPMILGVSLLAGIGAVDLADVVYTAFRQWARKVAGLEDEEGERNGKN
jgi:hypothetical protein